MVSNTCQGYLLPRNSSSSKEWLVADRHTRSETIFLHTNKDGIFQGIYRMIFGSGCRRQFGCIEETIYCIRQFSIATRKLRVKMFNKKIGS